jgi:hypothetical protein
MLWIGEGLGQLCQVVHAQGLNKNLLVIDYTHWQKEDKEIYTKDTDTYNPCYEVRDTIQRSEPYIGDLVSKLKYANGETPNWDIIVDDR